MFRSCPRFSTKKEKKSCTTFGKGVPVLHSQHQHTRCEKLLLPRRSKIATRLSNSNLLPKRGPQIGPGCCRTFGMWWAHFLPIRTKNWPFFGTEFCKFFLWIFAAVWAFFIGDCTAGVFFYSWAARETTLGAPRVETL